MPPTKFSFVDLFSGAGGMSYGFVAHGGFRPLAAFDAQKGKPSSGGGTLECNLTYAANIGIQPTEVDLSTLTAPGLLKVLGLRAGQLDILISCAPCTGFSRTLRRNHLQDDPRNALVGQSGEYVKALRPKIFLMENARELIRGNFSHHYENLKEALSSAGYTVRGSIHILSDFGLPQVRERALVVAVRDGLEPRTLEDLWEGYAPEGDQLTVRNAIESLPVVSAGQAGPGDPLHISPNITRPTLRRLQALPHDGGSWADLLDHPDAEELLIPSMKRAAARGDFGSHPDVYGRLWWDRPCVTIKRECAHVGNGRYSHPEQNRLCTVRELALLNGFPRSYKFAGTSLSNKYRHIGDAVPPLISYQIAHACHWILTGKKPDIRECALEGTSLVSSGIVTAPREPSLFDGVSSVD